MTDICARLEAVLFASGEPVPIGRLSLILNITEEQVVSTAYELKDIYESNNHSIGVLFLDKKIQICTKPDFATYVTKVLEQRKPPQLSQSALETLSIVAYYQPATNAYISKIRGVDSSYSISTLLDKGLIEVKGKLEAPGRPSLYGTTDVFLRTMNISSLEELPELPDISSNEGIEKLKEQIEALKETERLSANDINNLSGPA